MSPPCKLSFSPSSWGSPMCRENRGGNWGSNWLVATIGRASGSSWMEKQSSEPKAWSSCQVTVLTESPAIWGALAASAKLITPTSSTWRPLDDPITFGWRCRTGHRSPGWVFGRSALKKHKCDACHRVLVRDAPSEVMAIRLEPMETANHSSEVQEKLLSFVSSSTRGSLFPLRNSSATHTKTRVTSTETSWETVTRFMPCLAVLTPRSVPDSRLASRRRGRGGSDTDVHAGHRLSGRSWRPWLTLSSMRLQRTSYARDLDSTAHCKRKMVVGAGCSRNHNSDKREKADWTKEVNELLSAW